MQDQEHWDERYAEADRVWSGQPNGALVAEVTGMRPGRALDVGCGEGADALWLADLGWVVTALDVSEVALARARAQADRSGATVQWVHAGLLEASVSEDGFDLVSAQYPALLRTPDRSAEHCMVNLVAPSGTLLVVHHADFDLEHPRADGFDPSDYVSPGDVAEALDDDWRIEVQETRARHVSEGAGAHHTHDVVLRAVRRSD